MLIDCVVDAIHEGKPIGNLLRRIREDSEIMLQRDPEIMKQKRLGINVPRTEVADSQDPSFSKSAHGKGESVAVTDKNGSRSDDADEWENLLRPSAVASNSTADNAAQRITSGSLEEPSSSSS